MSSRDLSTTVVIATLNRANLLGEALESLTRQTLLPNDVIVVDNGSKDHTQQVAKSYSGRLPIIYVIEPKKGVAHARNRGIEVAKNDIIAFIDDDCIPDPDWLQNMVWRFEADPELGVVGGVTRARKPDHRGFIARFCYELFSRAEPEPKGKSCS